MAEDSCLIDCFKQTL